MITKLTPAETLTINLCAAWFEPRKRAAITRKLNVIAKAEAAAKKALRNRA